MVSSLVVSSLDTGLLPLRGFHMHLKPCMSITYRVPSLAYILLYILHFNKWQTSRPERLKCIYLKQFQAPDGKSTHELLLSVKGMIHTGQYLVLKNIS